MRRTAFTLILPFALAACQPGGDADIPGSRDDQQPYSEIGEGETLKFTGTEPFWVRRGNRRGRRRGKRRRAALAMYTITVSASRDEASCSGVLDGASFTMAVTPGTCCDGMSDRSYPFVAAAAR